LPGSITQVRHSEAKPKQSRPARTLQAGLLPRLRGALREANGGVLLLPSCIAVSHGEGEVARSTSRAFAAQAGQLNGGKKTPRGFLARIETNRHKSRVQAENRS